jgi:PhnB protein
MTIKAATPYLMLDGQADNAIATYQSALGATLESLQRFGDMDPSTPDAMKNRVMHAVLKFGDATLMLSDGGPGEGQGPAGRVSVALDMNDVAQCRKAYEGLTAKGKAVQPLIDAPWGALFGIAHDEYGVAWMFNCTK